MSEPTKPETKPKTKAVNICIPKKLYRELKIRAIDEDSSLRAICLEIFENGLKKSGFTKVA